MLLASATVVAVAHDVKTDIGGERFRRHLPVARMLVHDMRQRNQAEASAFHMPTSTVQAIKLAIVGAVGLPKDTLHVYVGLAVFLGVIVVFRKPPRSILPWFAAVFVASLGEALDMRDDISSLGYWRWSASVHDIVNTVFWPTAFLLVARFTKAFEDPRRKN
jgi:hypothetical protein